MFIPKISLRQVFVWTGVAGCLSAVLACASRGDVWATALIIGMVLGLGAFVITGLLYWVFLLLATVLGRREKAAAAIRSRSP